MQRRPSRRRINNIDAGAQLILMGKCIDHVEPAAEIDGKLFERLPLVL